VGAQHSANKADALVCSRCFSMIGSIEQQLAHRLSAREEQNGMSPLSELSYPQAMTEHSQRICCACSHSTCVKDALQEADYLVHLLLLLVKLNISLQLALPRAAQRQSQRMCFWSNSLDAFKTINDWAALSLCTLSCMSMRSGRPMASAINHGAEDAGSSYNYCTRMQAVRVSTGTTCEAFGVEQRACHALRSSPSQSWYFLMQLICQQLFQTHTSWRRS